MVQSLIPYTHLAQYYETDQMGIIHHSNYIRWFEEARSDLLDQLHFGYNVMEKKGVMIPVTEVTCTYKSMVHYNDSVYILPKITEFNGIRLTISYEIIDTNTKELRAQGTSSHCFLSRQQKIISIKKKHPEIFAIFEQILQQNLFFNN
ncbi:acyl-CoA thioesterase [Vagococcus entomophilus]|uniref:Acyl-CoA thioester hydrolase n=1 Tax=Vagococcus entomophilus TaxID=1160095 RepID=A0A430AJ62_9ENTE|nr:acyl-CoA thioesterase [Vagococcus entomophilus]RSU08053.1 acyl-CoA thioester hydrolase [Vagococcus entomophilus]